MASIRTVSFGDSSFKWNTGKIKDIKYDHDIIKGWHKNYIKPRFTVTDQSEVRKKALEIMRTAIVKKDVKSMSDLTFLIAAMRFTFIDANKINKDGNLDVLFMVPNNKYYEKVTFYNIPWHINNHCRQLYRFCFVQLKPKYSNHEISISYTTGEWKDKNPSDGIDYYPLGNNIK